jgi:hypothetical protein
MNALHNITQLFGVIAVAAFLWVVVLAFGTRVWWGFGVLFLSPLSAVIYGIKYWGKAKIPFVIYIVSFTTCTALSLYGFFASDGVGMLKQYYLAKQAVEHRAPDQKELVIQYLEKNVAFTKQSANTGADQEWVAVLHAYLEATKDGFPDEEWQTAKTRSAKFLERPGLTEKNKEGLSAMLDVVERLRQNTARNPVATVGTMSSPQVTIVPRQPVASSSIAKPVSLNTPKPVDTAATTPTPFPVPQTPEPKSPRPNPSPTGRLTRIAVSQAGRYIGADVMLVGNDGVTQRGRLVSAANNRLQIEERYTIGTISISYKTSEIKSLSLVRP